MAESGGHAMTVMAAAGPSNPVAFTVQDPVSVVNVGSWATVWVQWADGAETHEDPD